MDTPKPSIPKPHGHQKLIIIIGVSGGAVVIAYVFYRKKQAAALEAAAAAAIPEDTTFNGATGVVTGRANTNPNAGYPSYSGPYTPAANGNGATC